MTLQISLTGVTTSQNDVVDIYYEVIDIFFEMFGGYNPTGSDIFGG